MNIHSWQIWHTYSTFTDLPLTDLEEAGRLLVDAEVAICAIHRDGRTHWRTKNGDVRSGETVISMRPHDDKAVTELKTDNGGSPDMDEAVHALWFEYCLLRFHEMKLFHDVSQLPPEYLRAYIGKFEAKIGDHTANIYPVVKIFVNGVIMISFRVFSSETSVPLGEFVDNYVNFGLKELRELMVSPGIAKYAPSAFFNAYLGKTSFRVRWYLYKTERAHFQSVQALNTKSTDDEYDFTTSPLSHADDEFTTDNLGTVALTVFDTITYVLSKPTQGLRYLIFGRKRHPKVGQRWVGRPHVYVFKHDNQQETASANEQSHAELIRSVLMRSSMSSFRDIQYTHPQSLRQYDDYGCYITTNSSLWLWSGSGIKSEGGIADPNFVRVISAPQVSVEMIEYGYMLYVRLRTKFSNLAKSHEVIAARRVLSMFEQQLRDASPYGEIVTLMEVGLKNIGADNVRHSITENLSISSSESSLKEASASEARRIVLAILFGLIATPRLATDVIAPAWSMLGLWKPECASHPNLFVKFVTLVLVGGFIVLSFTLIRRRNR